MIVRMKKVTVLVTARERDAALLKLRKLGVIHVEHVRTPSAEELFSLESKLSDVDNALLIINAFKSDTGSEQKESPEKITASILNMSRQKEMLMRDLAEHQKDEQWFSIWGDVSLNSLEALNNAGLNIRFHTCTKKDLKTITSDVPIVIANTIENKVYFAHFAGTGADKLDCPEDRIPGVEVSELRRDIENIRNEIAQNDSALKKMSSEKTALQEYRKSLESKRELALARHGMGESEQIVWLQGYCPEKSVELIKKTADDEAWGYVFQEPDDPVETPTLVQNPAWIRIIKPVFSFMGTVPGYHEFDISFWFLLFFSLFYAMLVGDAGYGLIFLVATFAARIKFKKAPREPFALMYVLSIATVIWGALSGTWFGMTRIFEQDALPFLNVFVIQRISSIGGDQDFMMFLCFFIGAVHLTLAHLLIAARQINRLNCIAQAGWIAVIWGLFFVAETLVLGLELRSYALPLLMSGAFLIILFENYHRKMIIKGAVSSLANLPLSVIGAFSDVVSYLRLFAVGFATFIVASSFNQMAADAGNGLVGTTVAALIVFLGHSINIILAVMAVVVHGIRLNMLEFSGHLNMQWSGKPYQPLSTGSDKRSL
jgi:V/A-type H+/Na+-transporting ATPase subunit I